MVVSCKAGAVCILSVCSGRKTIQPCPNHSASAWCRVRYSELGTNRNCKLENAKECSTKLHRVDAMAAKHRSLILSSYNAITRSPKVNAVQLFSRSICINVTSGPKVRNLAILISHSSQWATFRENAASAIRRSLCCLGLGQENLLPMEDGQDDMHGVSMGRKIENNGMQFEI